MEFDERTLTPPLGVASGVIDRRRSQREAAGVECVRVPIPRGGGSTNGEKNRGKEKRKERVEGSCKRGKG